MHKGQSECKGTSCSTFQLFKVLKNQQKKIVTRNCCSWNLIRYNLRWKLNVFPCKIWTQNPLQQQHEVKEIIICEIVLWKVIKCCWGFTKISYYWSHINAITVWKFWKKKKKKKKKNSVSLSLLPFHKTKQSSLKKKNSLKLSVCSFSINRFNLLIAISEYEQEFGAPVAVLFVRKRWFLSNKELLLHKQICSLSNTYSVDDFFWVSCVQRWPNSIHSFNIINGWKHVNNVKWHQNNFIKYVFFIYCVNDIE